MADVKNICGYDVKDATARNECSSLDTRVTALEQAGTVLYADSPIGTIVPFGGGSNAIPSEWLFCDGSAISRTTYADLFSVIGTNYGSGDGSTTFNLPDMREVVPVGAGTSTRSGITTHDVYGVGEFKDDQLQTHGHNVIVNPNESFVGRKSGGSTELTLSGGQFFFYPTDGKTSNTKDCRNGTTTHGKSIGVNFIIKAKQATLPIDVQSALNTKQNITDNSLDTTDKTVVGAINEVNSALSDKQTTLKNNSIIIPVPFTNSNFGTGSINISSYGYTNILTKSASSSAYDVCVTQVNATTTEVSVTMFRPAGAITATVNAEVVICGY